MVYDLVRKNKEGTSLHPVNTYSTEPYADSHYDLYLTDELAPNGKKDGKTFITNYRLHAMHSHSVEDALAYDIHCPKCGRLMRQVGRSLSYNTLGLYTCKFCNEH